MVVITQPSKRHEMTNNAIEAAERDTYSVLEYKRNGKFRRVDDQGRLPHAGQGLLKRSNRTERKASACARGNTTGRSMRLPNRQLSTSAKQWEEIVADYRKAKALHQTFVRAEMAAARANGYYMVGDDQVPFREDRLLALMNESAPPLPVWPTKDVPKKTPAEV